jgi:hypothetical protein
MSESDAPELPKDPEDPPAEPKRLSFREANLGPEHRPETHTKPHGFFATRKRTVAISLLAVGAGAAAIYGVAHAKRCDSYPPDQVASCRQGGGGSGGHYWGFGSGSGNSSSTSTSSSVSRGGFGSTGSAHAGGGGE